MLGTLRLAAARKVGLAAALAVVSGCDSGSQNGTAPAGSQAPAAGGRVEIVAAPAEPADVAKVVASELERAKKDEKDLVVYVGATWCEPCQYFHEAAAAGKLDADFPRLRLLEFDLDRDRERLQAAGYGSRLIPLFAIPGPDGRGTGKQIEGSIKGPGSVREITPRLRSLLGG